MSKTLLFLTSCVLFLLEGGRSDSCNYGTYLHEGYTGAAGQPLSLSPFLAEDFCQVTNVNWVQGLNFKYSVKFSCDYSSGSPQGLISTWSSDAFCSGAPDLVTKLPDHLFTCCQTCQSSCSNFYTRLLTYDNNVCHDPSSASNNYDNSNLVMDYATPDLSDKGCLFINASGTNLNSSFFSMHHNDTTLKTFYYDTHDQCINNDFITINYGKNQCYDYNGINMTLPFKSARLMFGDEPMPGGGNQVVSTEAPIAYELLANFTLNFTVVENEQSSLDERQSIKNAVKFALSQTLSIDGDLIEKVSLSHYDTFEVSSFLNGTEENFEGYSCGIGTIIHAASKSDATEYQKILQSDTRTSDSSKLVAVLQNALDAHSIEVSVFSFELNEEGADANSASALSVVLLIVIFFAIFCVLACVFIYCRKLHKFEKWCKCIGMVTLCCNNGKNVHTLLTDNISINSRISRSMSAKSDIQVNVIPSAAT